MQEQTEVQSDTLLPISAEAACDALSALLRHDRSHPDPVPVRLVVSPLRSATFPAVHVRGDMDGPRREGSTYVFGLHWEPEGVAAAAYPTLDATVAVTPVDSSTSLLSILGHYSPPFGAVGAAADRAALSRVASATVAAVLERLAEAVTRPAPRVPGA